MTLVSSATFFPVNLLCLGVVLAGVVRQGYGLRSEDELADLAVFGVSVLAIVRPVREVDLHVFHLHESGSTPRNDGTFDVKYIVHRYSGVSAV